MFVRRDTYGRYVSVLVYLPRDRYNTARPRAVRRRSSRSSSAASRSSSPSGSTSRRPRACTSWCTRPRATTIPDVDTADLERRLDRGVALVARRLHRRRDRGVRRGGRHPPGPALRRLLPRGLQGGLLRRAPPRSTSAGSRRSDRGDEAASTSRSTSSWTPAAARPGSRSSGSAPPLSLSEVLPMLSLDGRRGRRRAALRARGPGAADVHLRVRPALRPARCPRAPASCSRTRCARCGTATTRSTASTRWCSAPG